MAVVFRLPAALDAAGLSQRQLTRCSGESLVTLNAIANNRTSRVDLETLAKVCSALSMEPGELLEREAAKRSRRH